jgi:hypothetical protein
MAKRKLTQEEWLDVDARVSAGESLRVVADSYGISHGTIAARLKKSAPARIELVATKLAEARTEKLKLPPAMQLKAEALAESLMITNALMLRSAKLAAGTAFRMSELANFKAQEIDAASIDPEDVRMVNALTETANKAAYQPMELLKANRELVNKQEDDKDTIGLTTGQRKLLDKLLDDDH